MLRFGTKRIRKRTDGFRGERTYENGYDTHDSFNLTDDVNPAAANIHISSLPTVPIPVHDTDKNVQRSIRDQFLDFAKVVCNIPPGTIKTLEYVTDAELYRAIASCSDTEHEFFLTGGNFGPIICSINHRFHYKHMVSITAHKDSMAVQILAGATPFTATITPSHASTMHEHILVSAVFNKTNIEVKVCDIVITIHDNRIIVCDDYATILLKKEKFVILTKDILVESIVTWM